MTGTTTPEVSVVLATYGRPDQLPRALSSLAEQTLAPERFEVVVVPNGPPLVRDVLEEARRRHPRLRLRQIASHRPGVAHARAVGVAAARGAWMTMLDDDDWISPAYLDRLLAAAAPGVVPLADIADIHQEGDAPDHDNPYSVAFRRRRGELVPAEELPEAVSLNVCKLLPTVTAQESGFDTRLRSASDTLFWLGVLARNGWRFSVLDVDDAVYYRVRGHGSLSRQDLSLDFSVVRRLEGLRSLAEVPRTRTSLEPVLDRTARSLSMHIRRLLLADPSRRAEVVDLAEDAGPAAVHWRTVNARVAEELLLLPGTDLGTSMVLAALRRVRERGRVVDVLSAGPTRRLRDAPDARPAHPFLGRLLTLPADRSTGSPAAAPVEDLERWALECVDTATERGTPYRTVRSVGDPASEALAEALTRARPDLHWAADLGPGARAGTVEQAGELVVGSPEELDALLGAYRGRASLARIRQRARIEPWRPLPAHLWQGAAELSEDVAVVAHLGDLDPDSLPVLADAIHELPARVRHEVQLLLCSSRTDQVRTAAIALGLGDVARARPVPGLLAGSDLAAAARVLLVDGPPPLHLRPEVAAHRRVVDVSRPGAGAALLAALAASSRWEDRP